MTTSTELSIIIVSYNVRQLLLDCIKSIIDTCSGIDYEIIVVDNVSSDGSVDALREAFPEVHVIANQENTGFARGNNQGYEMSKGEFILMLNPDTIVKPRAIQSTLEFMRLTPDAGLAGCRLLNPDGSLQTSIRRFPSLREHIGVIFFIDRLLNSQRMHYRTTPFAIDYCSGAFMMVRRKSLKNMPLLNQEYFMYSEEKDLSLRLKRKGWKTYFVPNGEVIHYGGQSTSQVKEQMFIELLKSQVLFFKRHYSGIYMYLMIWSFYLSLISKSLLFLLLIHTNKGRKRFLLFYRGAIKYPALMKSFDWKTKKLDRGGNKPSTLLNTIRELRKLPAVSISMCGCEQCKYYYGYFIKRHPRFKIIQNKKWGAALVTIPATFNDYLKGKKMQALRTNRTHAIKSGYTVGRFCATDRIQEILAINTSLHIRQGWLMSEDYLCKDELKKFFANIPPIFGVFNNEGILKAYAYVLICGDVCIIIRILGHGDNLGDGIMYYLVSEIIREVIELKQDRPKWLVYDTMLGAQTGLRYFKEKCGFKAYKAKWLWKEC